jgi:hypothetical protein
MLQLQLHFAPSGPWSYGPTHVACCDLKSGICHFLPTPNLGLPRTGPDCGLRLPRFTSDRRSRKPRQSEPIRGNPRQPEPKKFSKTVASVVPWSMVLWSHPCCVLQLHFAPVVRGPVLSRSRGLLPRHASGTLAVRLATSKTPVNQPLARLYACPVAWWPHGL